MAKKIMRKGMSILLSVTMLVSMLQSTALAAGPDPICGIPAHTHKESCYATVGAHAHGEDCYTLSGAHTHDETCEVIVGAHSHNEDCESIIGAHTHVDDCFAVVDGHSHSDDCFAVVAGHSHSDDCYSVVDGHSHGDGCFTVVGGHSHGDDCFAVVDGHSHGDGCFAIVGSHSHGDDCFAIVGGHSHGDGCFTVIPGHSHGDSCYTTIPGHSHSDGCYDESGALSCGLEESEDTTNQICDLEESEDTTNQICDLEESEGTEEQICGLEESEGSEEQICELEESEGSADLICGLEESEGSEEQICELEESEGSADLICGLEESEDAEELVCGLEESESTTALICDLEESEGTKFYICELEESEGTSSYICGLEESEGTRKQICELEESAGTRQLVCQAAEHRHEESCYPVELSKNAKRLLDKQTTAEARVYLLYENEIPGNINQSFGINKFGPQGDNTPYFIATVDLVELLSDGTVDVYWNSNGQWYISVQSGTTGQRYTAESLWEKILDCMSARDQEKFDEFFHGMYIGYVLKDEAGRNGTEPHIDGVMLEEPPVYFTELKINGDVVGTFLKSGNGTRYNNADGTHYANEILAKFEQELQEQYGDITIDWDAKTFTDGQYIWDFTLTGNSVAKNGYPNYTEITRNIYYVAAYSLNVGRPTALYEDYTLTVNWVNQKGEAIASQLVDTKREGSPYITEQKEIDGYKFLEMAEDSDPASGVMDSDKVVTYVYAVKMTPIVPIKTYSLTVNWVNQKGEAIASQLVQTKQEGKDYTTEQKEIEGYKFLEMAEDSDPVSGTMDSDKVVTYVYAVKMTPIVPIQTYSLTVNWVNQKGEAIASQLVQTKQEGKDYTTEQKEIDGYKFLEMAEDSDPVSGTMDSDKVVTYVYAVKATPIVPIQTYSLTVNWVNQKGEAIASQLVQTKQEGKDYTTEQKEIEGYKFLEMAEDSDPVSGTMNSDKVVTYVYAVKATPIVPIKTYSLTVNWFNQKGEAIASQLVQTKQEGKDYATEQKEIDGYKFLEMAEDSDPVSGTMDSNKVVTYVYAVKATPIVPIQTYSLTVNWVNQKGEAIASQLVQTKQEGKDYATEQKEIDGYKFLEMAEDSDPVSGIMDSDKVVTYVYAVKMTPIVPIKTYSLTVNWVNQKGEAIASQLVQTKQEGKDYTTDQKEIDGYKFLEMAEDSDPVSGTMDSDKVVTYVYAVNQPPVDPGPSVTPDPEPDPIPTPDPEPIPDPDPIPTPDPEPIVTPDPEPPVEIDEPEVPLIDIPEELEELEEEEVPLADVPVTGDPMMMYAAIAAVSGMGLVVLNKKSKEDEE